MGIRSGRLHDAVTTAQLSAKADKAQGAWISPTLAGTWVELDAARTPKYRKDTLNRVVFKGAIKSGTLNTLAFTLPEGYRPLQTVYFVGNANNAAVGYWSIASSGQVIPHAGSTAHMALDSISFTID